MLPLDLLHPTWLPVNAQKKSGARALRLPYFFSLRQDGAASLEAILRQPHALFLEIGEHRRMEEATDAIMAAKPDFALSLTTASAWHEDIAHIAAHALHEHFGLQDAKAMQITTCLQEAVTNAIVHGNLGLESSFASRQDMERYYAAVEERIGKAIYKDRRVNILAWDRGHALEIAVSDSGGGFSLPSARRNNRMPHGRGLMLIGALANHVWVGRDRKSLHMTFAYRG